jgi:predicted nucleic acid-binding Zn ribbon protein
MRRSNIQSIGDVMKEILNDRKINKGIMETRVVNNWEKVLGKPVARVTNRLYFRHGVLYVELNSSVVRNELVMLKDKIIKNLNDTIGSDIVREIVFR